MIRRLVSLLTAAALAVLTTLSLGSTPAMAAFSDCPSGEVCWWANANGMGSWGHRTAANISSVGCWSMSVWGNQASSWRTRLSSPWHGAVFHDGSDGTSCYGRTVTVGAFAQGNFIADDDNWLGGISVY